MCTWVCTCLGLFGRVKVRGGVRMGEAKAGLRRLVRRLMRVATRPSSSAPTPMCVCVCVFECIHAYCDHCVHAVCAGTRPRMSAHQVSVS